MFPNIEFEIRFAQVSHGTLKMGIELQRLPVAFERDVVVFALDLGVAKRGVRDLPHALRVMTFPNAAIAPFKPKFWLLRTRKKTDHDHYLRDS